MALEGAACQGFDPGYWDTSTRRSMRTHRVHTSRMGTVKIGGVVIQRQKQIALAKNVCAGCPVITQCLQLGMYEEEGIWGGKLPDER